jgi:hypothetical protein
MIVTDTWDPSGKKRKVRGRGLEGKYTAANKAG